MVFTGIIGLGCGLGMAGDMTTVKGIVLLAIGQRILAIAFVSAVIGLVMGSVSKVAIALSTGVLLADLALFVFLHWTQYSVRFWGHNYLQDFLANPIAVLALIIYPVVAANSRTRALTVGISLWVVLPPIAVASSVIRYPHTLVLVILSLLAAIATLVGVLGTLVARTVVELWERVTGTKIAGSKITKPDETYDRQVGS
jgi:hypothetical protein